MKAWKSGLVLFTVLVLLTSGLFSVGATAQPEKAKPEVVKLEFSNPQIGEPATRIMWEELMEEFNKEHPNINVWGEYITFNDYWDQLTVRLHAGTAPDLIWSLSGGWPPSIVAV